MHSPLPSSDPPARCQQSAGSPLSVYLRDATRSMHGSLDAFLIGQRLFESTLRYGRFLQVQWHFHHAAAPLYMDGLMLPATARLQLVEQDLLDMGAPLPRAHAWRPRLQHASRASALGWLYTVEGSALGSAVLLKYAAALGLGAGHGARHLAPSPAGVAEQWRITRAHLDAEPLTQQQRQQACNAAQQAFAFVRRCAAEVFSNA